MCVQSASPFIAMLEMKKKLETKKKKERRQNDASFTMRTDNKPREMLAQMQCD